MTPNPDQSMTLYSFVIPAFNESPHLEPLQERIRLVMSKLDRKFEIIFVNNGSTDKTREILKNLTNKFTDIIAVNLTRNFGYDGAICAGMDHVNGNRIIVMDGDQQDPPEALPPFIKKAETGVDIVYGVRKKRPEGFLSSIKYRMFYRVFKMIAVMEIPLDAGNFCVMTRRVANFIVNAPERQKFVRGLRAWSGFSSTGIDYSRELRPGGESKFGFLELLRYSISGLLMFTDFPLRLLSWLGAFGIFVSVTGALYCLLAYLIALPVSIGYVIAFVVLFAFSLNFLSLGILGMYIGAIFTEVQRRPTHVVDSVLGGHKVNS